MDIGLDIMDIIGMDIPMFTSKMSIGTTIGIIIGTILGIKNGKPITTNIKMTLTFLTKIIEAGLIILDNCLHTTALMSIHPLNKESMTFIETLENEISARELFSIYTLSIINDPRGKPRGIESRIVATG